MQVRRGYAALLEGRAERWAGAQAALVAAIGDLSAFYTALRAVPRAAPPADLTSWFAALSKQVGGSFCMPPGFEHSYRAALLDLGPGGQCAFCPVLSSLPGPLLSLLCKDMHTQPVCFSKGAALM